MPKVEKTGTYRHKSGHAIHLRKGQEVTAEVAKAYTFDEGGTKRRAEKPEPTFMSGVVDAPQQRAEPPVENRAEPPVENREAGPDPSDAEPPVEGQKDADLAANAAKGKKA